LDKYGGLRLAVSAKCDTVKRLSKKRKEACMNWICRRDFLKLAGAGGAFLITCRSGVSFAAGGESVRFIQISDTHIGFSDPAINPEYATTLKKAVAAINAMEAQPDFVVFTGDLTHTTDDPVERKKRLVEFKNIVDGLRVKDVRFLPGEHDAALDKGEAYQEVLGPMHYAFTRNGVAFLAVDNVSDPSGSVGDAQREWMGQELKKLSTTDPIVILTHRPLFDLAPDWDWATRDGAQVMELLTAHQNVTVLYGHIHQVHHHETGRIGHHAAAGMMYPLPAPMSVPKKGPIPWDPAAPYKGLGYREARQSAGAGVPALTEIPMA